MVMLQLCVFAIHETVFLFVLAAIIFTNPIDETIRMQFTLFTFHDRQNQLCMKYSERRGKNI